MKKDRNCGAVPYPIYPTPNMSMNPNMAPGMMPMNPNMAPGMMPMNPNMSMNPNMGVMPLPSNNLEAQVNNLMTQMNSLERRVAALESAVGNTNFSTNYNTSNYQMM